MFSTAADNQPAVEIHVVQGEREMAADNTSLGRFQLEGIPPAPRGVPQIEVTFDIDANGIINVTAKDKGTGKEQKITIASSNKLSKDEIDSMVKQAEQFADADKKKKEEIEVKNQAETAVYSVKKSLDELGDKVTNEERAKVEAAISDLENANKGGNVTEIKAKLDALYKSMEPISQKIYQQQGQQQDGCNCGGNCGGAQQQAEQPQQKSQESSKKDDGFVDADYKIVDDQ